MTSRVNHPTPKKWSVAPSKTILQPNKARWDLQILFLLLVWYDHIEQHVYVLVAYTIFSKSLKIPIMSQLHVVRKLLNIALCLRYFKHPMANRTSLGAPTSSPPESPHPRRTPQEENQPVCWGDDNVYRLLKDLGKSHKNVEKNHLYNISFNIVTMKFINLSHLPS